MPNPPLQKVEVTTKPDEHGRIQIRTPPGFNLQAIAISDEPEKREDRRPPLSGIERGIIISPDKCTISEREVCFSISNSSLHRYLFFWDKLQCVVSTFSTHRGQLSSPGLDVLEDEGILKKSFWNSLGQGHPLAQVQHAQQMDFFMDPNPQWALGECGPAFFEPPGQELLQAADLDLQLINAIELPSADVHVERILEFKEQRKAELLRLRMELMSIRDQILSSATPVTARNLAFQRLSDALHSLNQCSRESFPSRVKSSLSVDLNVKSVLDAWKTGALTFAASGDIRLAMVAGALDMGASSIQLSVRSLRKPPLPLLCSDYHYAFEVQDFLRRSHQNTIIG